MITPSLLCTLRSSLALVEGGNAVGCLTSGGCAYSAGDTDLSDSKVQQVLSYMGSLAEEQRSQGPQPPLHATTLRSPSLRATVHTDKTATPPRACPKSELRNPALTRRDVSQHFPAHGRLHIDRLQPPVASRGDWAKLQDRLKSFYDFPSAAG